MNLVNTEYITLENLLDSIKSDFKKYDNAGIIDDNSLYKVVAYCNAQAGVRIQPIEWCVGEIENSRMTMPENLKKIQKIDIISNFRTPSSLPLYQNWTEQVSEKPTDNTPLYTPIGCHNDCGQCYWVVPHKPITEQWLVFTEHNSLQEGNHSHSLKKNEYLINREEEIIQFGISSGKAILTYYSDLDALGLIPKHPMLYFYYEWSLKVKILQDIMMNSEDDVANKLAYAEKQLFLSYVDFDNYIKSENFKKQKQRYKKQEQEFFSKWFAPIL